MAEGGVGGRRDSWVMLGLDHEGVEERAEEEEPYEVVIPVEEDQIGHLDAEELYENVNLEAESLLEEEEELEEDQSVKLLLCRLCF